MYKMLNKFSKVMAVAMLGVFSLGAVAAPAFAADTVSKECAKLQDGSINPNCTTDEVKTINDKIYKFASIISGIVLGIGVLMIVYAGFKYATSQGDPKTTEQAKMQIIAAGIGIGISMLAFVILNIFKSLF